jgi:hypothetical protein
MATPSINPYSVGYTYRGTNVFTKTTTAPNAAWKSITSSSTGQYLAACINGGGIYTSSNYGVNWSITNAPSTSWSSITISSSGELLAACNSGGEIYTSQNYGVTWSAQTNGLPVGATWTSIASSGNGKYLSACISNGGIYRSSDYGVNWSAASVPVTTWSSITISSSGQIQCACINGGSGSSSGAYYSHDYGNNWVQSDTAYVIPGNYVSIASSSSGQYIVMCSNNITSDSARGIFLSTTYGKDFSVVYTTNFIYTAVTISGNGQTIFGCLNNLAIGAGNNRIYLIDNYGAIRTAINSSPSASWSSITMSRNGKYVNGCVNSGSNAGIYIYSKTMDIGNTWGLLIEDLQLEDNNPG